MLWLLNDVEAHKSDYYKVIKSKWVFNRSFKIPYTQFQLNNHEQSVMMKVSNAIESSFSALKVLI